MDRVPTGKDRTHIGEHIGTAILAQVRDAVFCAENDVSGQSSVRVSHGIRSSGCGRTQGELDYMLSKAKIRTSERLSRRAAAVL